MSIVSTYKQNDGSSKKIVMTSEEARYLSDIVEKILPLEKYQKVIRDLRIGIQSQIGVTNFVTGMESGEILDAILQSAFPRDAGQVYMGDRDAGYNFDASTWGDHQEAVNRFTNMLLGNQSVMDSNDVKRLETMKGEFKGPKQEYINELAALAMQVTLANGALPQGAGGAPGGAFSIGGPAPAQSNNPSTIQATIETRKKLVDALDLVRTTAEATDRMAKPKEYDHLINQGQQLEKAIRTISAQLPAYMDDVGQVKRDRSGFVDFEIRVVNKITQAIDNLIDPQKMNKAIDDAASNAGASGASVDVKNLSVTQRRMIAKKLVERVKTKLEQLKVGGKPAVIEVVNKINVILDKGVDGVQTQTPELKRLRDELAHAMRGQQKVWIIQNVSESGLLNRPYGTPDQGPDSKSQFLPRALLKATMAKKDAVSGGRCILFISAEPIDFGFAGASVITLPSGVGEDEADAILRYFSGVWAAKMKAAGVEPNAMNKHLKLRFGDKEKLKMLIAGVPHKEAIHRLDNAFSLVYDPAKMELDGKKMTQEVTRISNESAAAGAGGGAKGLTFMDAKMKWEDYIWKDDDKYEWGDFCDSTMNGVNMAKDLWEKESMYRAKLEEAMAAKDEDGVVKWTNKMNQVAGAAKNFLSMPHFLILYGEAASGKSSFAEALANLLEYRMVDVDLGQARGMYAGQTEGQSKALMNAVKSMSNVVVRMDEIDGQVAGQQDAAVNSHNAAVVQQLLSFFNDNIALLNNRHIFVIATTNNPGYIRSQMLSRGVPFEVPLPLNKAGYLKFLSNAPDRLRRVLGKMDFIYWDFVWGGKQWNISSETEANAFIQEAWKTLDLDAIAEALERVGDSGHGVDFRSLTSLLKAIFGEFQRFVTTTSEHHLWLNNRKEYADDNPGRCTEPGNPMSCPEPEIKGMDLTTEGVLQCVKLTRMAEVPMSYGTHSRGDGSSILFKPGVYPYLKKLQRDRDKAKNVGNQQPMLFTDEQLAMPETAEEEEDDLLVPAGAPVGGEKPDDTPPAGGGKAGKAKNAKSTNHFFNALVKDGLVTWDGRQAFISPKAPVPPGVMMADETPSVSVADKPSKASTRRRRSLEEKIGEYVVGTVALVPCNRKVIL